jgi:DNA-directed RNA polymerase beta subunit
MTTYATFVINGCERVIVSQIIRSPGVYFEKNKNQRTPNKFKRKLSTDINKLRSFTSWTSFISELIYFSLFQRQYWINKQIGIEFNLLLFFKYLKVNRKKFFFLFFTMSFKLYRIISKNSEYNSKIKLIQLFLKWLKLQNNILNLKNNLEKNKIIYLLKYYNFLVKLLIKYKILQLI